MRLQGLVDDWRVRLAFPFFLLIDFLLSRQRVARYLFNSFRTKGNLKNVLKARRCTPHLSEQPRSLRAKEERIESAARGRPGWLM